MAANRDLELLVRLIADTKSINQGVQQVNGKLSSLGKTVGRLGIGLGIGLGLKEAIDFTGEAIGLAKDLEEAQNRVDAIFGDSAREVRRWAADSATAYRLTENEAARALGDLGSLFKGAGLAGQELADASTLAAQAVGDIASFANLSSVEAMTKVMSGLAGEVEPLRRIGIDLSVTNVRNLAEQLGVDDLPLVQQRMAALQFQLDNLGVTGDSIRTLDSAVGKTEQLRVKWENLKTRFGEAVLPLQIGIVDALNTALDNLNGISDAWDFLMSQIEAANNAEGTVTKLAYTFDDLAKALGLSTSEMAGLVGRVPEVLEFQRAWYRGEETLEMYNAALEAGKKAIEEFTGGTEEQVIAQRELMSQLEATRIAWEQAAAAELEANKQAILSAKSVTKARSIAAEAGLEMATVLTEALGGQDIQLFDFDFGSPKEWVADINKELRNTNVELRNFLESPKAQRSLQQGVQTMNRRLKSLLNLTTKTADLDTAGGNLMTVFGASVLAKVGKAKGDVGAAMEELGLTGAGKFAKQFKAEDIIAQFPTKTAMSSVFFGLGLAARTGFLRGFGNPVASATSGATTGTGSPTGFSAAAPVSIYISGDPAVIESTVLRALRTTGMSNGAVTLGDRLHRTLVR